MLDGWNYEIDRVPEGDCRKLVTLEQDGMVWVGIRAFHHESKSWMSGGEPVTERVVAWRDYPTPADPRIFAVPREQTEAFEREMQEKVIPEMKERQRRQAEAAAEARHRVIF